jgi:hypothetical protein
MRREPGAIAQARSPHFTHVPCELVGIVPGDHPLPLVLFTNSTINEFADGLTDAVAYDVASVLSYALVSSVAPIAT